MPFGPGFHAIRSRVSGGTPEWVPAWFLKATVGQRRAFPGSVVLPDGHGVACADVAAETIAIDTGRAVTNLSAP